MVLPRAIRQALFKSKQVNSVYAVYCCLLSYIFSWILSSLFNKRNRWRNISIKTRWDWDFLTEIDTWYWYTKLLVWTSKSIKKISESFQDNEWENMFIKFSHKYNLKSNNIHFIHDTQIYLSYQGGRGIDCKCYWIPKFYNHIILFVGFGYFLKFNQLVPNCSNFATNNFNCFFWS